MTDYINVPIETDPDTLAQAAFAKLETLNPGWAPDDAQLDTWIIEANAEMAATLRDLASDVPKAIFRSFGALVNIPPIDDALSSVTLKFTVQDTAGYTIPGGTAVQFTDSQGVQYVFKTAADAIVAGGATTVTGVLAIAIEAEAASSNIGAANADVTLLDTYAYITRVQQEGITAGGADAETDDAYLGRLARQLRLMAPRPIIPIDFAEMARNVPGVYRALCVDGWDAVAGTGGHAKTVSIAALDSNGDPVSAAVKTAIDSYLQSFRESNFIIYVADPSIYHIDMTWDVDLFPNFDPASVTAAINAALANEMNALNWGADQDNTYWYNRTKVRINDHIAVIGAVPGVKTVNTVQHEVYLAGSLVTTDINMTNFAPLAVFVSATGTTH
jgi:hypothetical protein